VTTKFPIHGEGYLPKISGFRVAYMFLIRPPRAKPRVSWKVCASLQSHCIFTDVAIDMLISYLHEEHT